MGATGWAHFVPYQPDIAKALHELQHQVLTQGDFGRPSIELSFLDELGLLEADAEERESIISQYGLEALREPLERLGPQGLCDWLTSLAESDRPLTMNELDALQTLSTDLTGSILDIARVTDSGTDAATGEMEYDAVFPLSRDLLMEAFGTDQPTRDQVEAKAGSPVLLSAYHRNQGIYLTVYRDGQPDELYFEGATGD